MLNVFPQFLLPFLAPFILRVGVGVVYLVWSYEAFSGKRWKDLPLPLSIGISVSVFLSAVALLVGFLTQAASLLLLLITLYFIVFEKKERVLNILLCFALLSLFISGAGALAFDLPL